MSCLEHLSIRKLLGSSGSTKVPFDERSQMIFVGVDWAEAHHDVHVMDEWTCPGSTDRFLQLITRLDGRRSG